VEMGMYCSTGVTGRLAAKNLSFERITKMFYAHL
jgi:hypothetical protein